MNKAFLSVLLLRSPTFMSAPPSLRGHWTQLQGLCAEHENDGIIPGAGTWNDAAWRAALGAGGSRRAVDAMKKHGLVKRVGDDIHLTGYDHESQALYEGRRRAGAKGGKASAVSRASAATTLEPSSNSLEPSSNSLEPSSNSLEPSSNSLEPSLPSAAVENGEAEVTPIVASFQDIGASTAQANSKQTSSSQGEERNGKERNGTERRVRREEDLIVPREHVAQLLPNVGKKSALMPDSPALAALDQALRFRKAPPATQADRQAIADHFDALPPSDRPAFIDRMARNLKNTRSPSVATFLASERPAQWPAGNDADPFEEDAI